MYFSVSQGASYHAFTYICPYQITTRLIDTIPVPIGLEVVGGRFDVFIEDGTQLPCSKTKQYHTSYDNQTSAEFKIYEGFDSFTSSSDMKFIDTIVIEGFPKAKEKQIKFSVTMSVSEYGKVSMTANCLDGRVPGKVLKPMNLSIVNQKKKSINNSMKKSIEHKDNFWNKWDILKKPKK